MNGAAADLEPPALDRYQAGVVQLDVRTDLEDDNRRRAAEWVERGAQAGCRLVVLPEAFQTGLNLPRSRKLAEPVPGPGTEWLGRLARQHGIYLAAGLLERQGGEVHSSAVLIDDAGELLAVHRKNFLVQEERPFLAPGRSAAVVETPLGRIGLLLGYEIHFPEVSRILFAQGVEVLIYCGQLLRPFVRSARILALARAAESSCHLLLASATGGNPLAKLVYMGSSLILRSAVGVRPYSDELRGQEPVLAEADTAETLLTAEVSLGAQRRLHAVDPMFRDLRASRFARAEMAVAEPSWQEVQT
jgi:predicted amidohydrolase